MKSDAKAFGGRFKANPRLLLAVILLLFPSSASVLCIAPGSHVAVEDINAPCTLASGASSRGQSQAAHEGFALIVSGQCCTDIFMTPNARGAVLRSSDIVAPDTSAHAGLKRNAPPDSTSPPEPLGLFKEMDLPITIFPSPPLRC